MTSTRYAQRQQIIAAMFDTVGELGYQNTTVELLLARAEVDPSIYQEQFSDLEDCFIAALDGAMGSVAARLISTFRGTMSAGGDSHAALRDALRTALTMAANHPNATRLCVHEARFSGTRALAHYDRAIENFGRLLTSTRDVEGWQKLPALVSGALAAGIARVVERVAQEQMNEPIDVSEDLVIWLSGYLTETVAEQLGGLHPAATAQRTLDITFASSADQAQSTMDTIFADWKSTLPDSEPSDDLQLGEWLDRVARSLDRNRRLASRLLVHPTRSSRDVDRLSALLERWITNARVDAGPPATVALQATVGALLQALHKMAAADQLPSAGPLLTVIACTPSSGSDRAIAAARAVAARSED